MQDLVLTEPRQNPKPKEKNKPNIKLIQVLKVQYKGTKDMIFKDTQGQGYAIKHNDILYIPKGSLETHIKARKNLFEILK